MLNKIFLVRFSAIAYVVLFINSYTAWIKWNPLSSSLTMTFIQSFVVFMIMLLPMCKYGLIRKNYKNRCFNQLNIFIVYTIGLSLYSLYVNTSGIEKQDFALLWMYIQAMLSCVLIYTFIDPYWFYKIFRIVLKATPWLLLFLLPIAKEENIGGLAGFIIRPTVFILIFISIMEFKGKVFYIFLNIACMVLSYFYDARSNLVIPLVCFLLGLMIKWNSFDKIRHIIWLFIIAPFILLYLGISGTFNVFEADKYVTDTSLKEGTLSDTRTFLYYEVLVSSIKNESLIWGRGIGRGYESVQQEGATQETKSVSKRGSNERQSEVGIHNIFTWGGVVYLIVYTLMWCSVLFYGVYKSRNRYARAVGFYLAFYYLYSWVENFQSFSITFISLWFMVALCLSPYFRRMDDEEFKFYFTKLLK